MTRPEIDKEALAEVLKLLARGMPQNFGRLIDDIRTIPKPSQGHMSYDE